MGEPKRFLTRLPPVPESRHNQLRGFHSQTPETSRRMWASQTAWGNPRHGGWEPWGSCVEGRGGRPGGERFARESFIPQG
eukprot:595308-Prorocentrum_minimum.AAC.1